MVRIHPGLVYHAFSGCTCFSSGEKHAALAGMVFELLLYLGTQFLLHGRISFNPVTELYCIFCAYFPEHSFGSLNMQRLKEYGKELRQ